MPVSHGISKLFLGSGFLSLNFQAYHSQIKDYPGSVGNLALLPIRTQYRGPAPIGNTEQDIIDEALYYFKANVFFRTYEVKVKLLDDSYFMLRTFFQYNCLNSPKSIEF